jgi:hypothetical protein
MILPHQVVVMGATPLNGGALTPGPSFAFQSVKTYRFQLLWSDQPHEVHIEGYRCCESGCKYQIKTYRPDLFRKHATRHEFDAFVTRNR